MSIRPAWELGDGGSGDGDNGFARSQQTEYDQDVQGSYGLDRLEVFECEVRHGSDVARALTGADAVVFCASTFNEGRTRPPERLDNFNRASAALGADLFELRVRTSPALAPRARAATSHPARALLAAAWLWTQAERRGGRRGGGTPAERGRQDCGRGRREAHGRGAAARADTACAAAGAGRRPCRRRGSRGMARADAVRARFGVRSAGV